MLAVAQRAIGGHAADGGAVVGLGAEPMIVERVDRRARHRRRAELVEPGARGLADARRDIFPPRLIGGDAQRLRGLDLAAVFDEALPALPREFVVVADADERKMRAGVLDVGIVDMRAIDMAIAGEVGRHVEIAHLAAVGNAAEVVDGARIAVRHLVGIFDDFVDEVAQMEHEAELAIGGRALVLPDHPAKGVLRAFVDAVARHEGEADGARVAGARRGDRAPDPAAGAAVVGEAVPIGRRRQEAADQRAARPVGRRQHRRACPGNDAAEIRISRHFHRQCLPLALVEWPSGPQDHAVIVRIARCDSLGKRRTVLPPYDSRRRGSRSRRPHANDS